MNNVVGCEVGWELDKQSMDFKTPPQFQYHLHSRTFLQLDYFEFQLMHMDKKCFRQNLIHYSYYFSCNLLFRQKFQPSHESYSVLNMTGSS